MLRDMEQSVSGPRGASPGQVPSHSHSQPQSQSHSAEGSQRLRHKTLSAYHDDLYDLKAYLASGRHDSTSVHGVLFETDPQVYKDLLLHARCAPATCAPPLPLLSSVKRHQGPTHAEVIDEILSDVSRRAGERRDAILLGLTNRADPDLPINPSRPSFENRYANSPSAALRTLPWKILRSRIGNAAFRHLFTHTSLYLPLGNNCFIQICGPLVHELYKHQSAIAVAPSDTWGKELKRPRVRGGGDELRRVKKRRKKTGQREDSRAGVYGGAKEMTMARRFTTAVSTSAKASPSPAERTILRGKMFYGQQNKMRNGRFSYGLPSYHILNQLPSTPCPSDTTCISLIQHIFPSLCKNLPPHLLSMNSNSSSFPSTSSRVLVSCPGAPRFPSLRPSLLAHLERLIPFTRELILRHATFNCRQAVRRCLGRIGDLAREEQVPLPKVTHMNVGRFVTMWVRGMFSDEMLGKENKGWIVRHAKSFIGMKQHETLHLHSLIQGISTSSIPCLNPSPATPADTAGRAGRTNQTGQAKSRELLEDLVSWIFNEMLMPILKNTFYITETAATRYETVYYLHSHWRRASQPHWEALEGELLEPLSTDDAYFAQHSTLGVAAVRLVPKPNGFRPIVNLGKRVSPSNIPGRTATSAVSVGVTATGRANALLPQGAGRGGKGTAAKLQSANQLLRGVHQVLMYEKDRRRAELGNTLFGTNEVFAPLHDLKVELQSEHELLPQLFFVKMDIRAAFDTIDQDKMLEVVEAMLDKDHDYCLVLYALLLPPASKASQGSARRLFRSKAISDAGDSPLTSVFGSHAHEIAEPMRNAVLVDLMRRKRVTKESVMELLKKHITKNVWQVNGKLLRQKRGIPQGSKVSSLLCSFFYAALEREFLQFVNVRGTRLLRYIDDFLLITDSLPLARRFVDRMNSGFPSYGAFVSRGKTLVSFECRGVEAVCIGEGRGMGNDPYFPYCGFRVDMRTLDVSMDYSKIIAAHANQSFALRSNRHKGAGFIGWFSRQLENRNHVAYLDTRHNDIRTVPHYFGRSLGDVVDNRANSDSDKTTVVERRAKKIFYSLCSAIEYTHVAGRARVKHATKQRERHRDRDRRHERQHAGIKSEITTMDPSVLSESDTSRKRANRTTVALGHDILETASRSLEEVEDYAITRFEFQYLALSALYKAISRKAAHPVWRAIVSSLNDRLDSLSKISRSRMGADVSSVHHRSTTAGVGLRKELDEVIEDGWRSVGVARH